MKMILAAALIAQAVQLPHVYTYLNTPCMAQATSAAKVHEATYAVAPLDSAERIAAQTMAQVLKDCPPKTTCRIISVKVLMEMSR
jgi:hypothetical protein